MVVADSAGRVLLARGWYPDPASWCAGLPVRRGSETASAFLVPTSAGGWHRIDSLGRSTLGLLKDVYRVGRRAAVVLTERITGPTLGSVLCVRAELSATEAAGVAQDLLRELAAAHDAGLAAGLTPSWCRVTSSGIRIDPGGLLRAGGTPETDLAAVVALVVPALGPNPDPAAGLVADALIAARDVAGGLDALAALPRSPLAVPAAEVLARAWPPELG